MNGLPATNMSSTKLTTWSAEFDRVVLIKFPWGTFSTSVLCSPSKLVGFSEKLLSMFDSYVLHTVSSLRFLQFGHQLLYVMCVFHTL